MIRKELEKKYGKKVVDKIFRGKYLEGCTILIRKDGEEDITRAIRTINGEKVTDWD